MGKKIFTIFFAENFVYLNLCTLFSVVGVEHLPYWLYQGSHRLEKYLNLEGFLEKSLKLNLS